MLCRYVEIREVVVAFLRAGNTSFSASLIVFGGVRVSRFVLIGKRY